MQKPEKKKIDPVKVLEQAIKLLLTVEVFLSDPKTPRGVALRQILRFSIRSLNVLIIRLQQAQDKA